MATMRDIMVKKELRSCWVDRLSRRTGIVEKRIEEE